jgi:hypothetical protein
MLVAPCRHVNTVPTCGRAIGWAGAFRPTALTARSCAIRSSTAVGAGEAAAFRGAVREGEGFGGHLVIEGLLLVLVGIALIVATVMVLRSARIRGRLESGNASVRSLLRLESMEQETFVRLFEMGIYVGMCLGSLLVILGVFVALA